jgi:hypothetical protein
MLWQNQSGAAPGRRSGCAGVGDHLFLQPRAGCSLPLHGRAKRTRYLRSNDFTDPEPVPKGTEYSNVIVSNLPIVMKHTRLDIRQTALALLSIVAFPVD